MARSTVCRRDCEKKRKAQPTKVSCQCSASYDHKKYRGLLSQFPSRFRDFPSGVDTQVHASISNATRGSHKRALAAGTSNRTTDALSAPPNKRICLPAGTKNRGCDEVVPSPPSYRRFECQSC